MMKRLSTIMMCLFAMMATSLSAKAQEVTINLFPGWNWISYPNSEMQDVNTALSDFVPVNGDIIQSQFSSSTYVNGYWRGGVTHFMPGWGYMYYSNRTEMVSFVFGTPAPQVIVTTAEPTNITTNSVVCGGNVASSNGDYITVTLRGICWSTNPNPTFNDNYIESGDGLGSFTISMTELVTNLTYYVRAFAVTPRGTFYGNEISINTQTWPYGILPGAFSVSQSQQVYFSQGNLQYQASTDIWRFADNQWDYVETQTPDSYGFVGGTVSGSDNNNISSNYSGWIDLFGWSTSGYDHGSNCYQPWSTSQTESDYYAYGNCNYNLYDLTGQADWGYNPISNGGNMEGLWRTLTNQEWQYVFYERTTTSGMSFVRAKVNGVNGVILLPDDWTASIYTLYNGNYNTNIITATDWTNIFELNGAVFLPAEGYRDGTSVSLGNSDGSYGFYWSATNSDIIYAFDVAFFNNGIPHAGTQAIFNRCCGLSVRLVRDVE